MIMSIAAFDLIEEFHSEDVMSLNHSRLIQKISVKLEKFDAQYDIFPELELELNGIKVKPDICIYPNLKIDWLNDVIFMNNPPITAIEILSPKQALTDLTDKVMNVFLPSGVKSAWVVIPTVKTIYLFQPNQEVQTFSFHDTFTDPATDIAITVAELFS
jgi:Uma2 family endonuclease